MNIDENPQVSPLDSSSGETTPSHEDDFVLDEGLALESGSRLTRPVLHYAIYGRLNEARDNVVLVCHALSGSALAGRWWPELFAGTGDGPRLIDLERDCVICINILGSCYGSTGPGSVNPDSGPEEERTYGPDFPLVSIRDNVRAQACLLDALKVETIGLAIGGSIGGMQALEWAILFPQRVKRAVVVGVAPLSALGLALNHLQRQAIVNDSAWQGGNYLPEEQPRKGLAAARQIAMLSYKSPQLFAERFGRRPNRGGEDPWAAQPSIEAGMEGGSLIGGRFDVAGYLDHQGERFVQRFDANSYLAILRMMETWDPARGYSSNRDAFSRIEAHLTFVGISSDWLFPPADVRRIAEEVRASGAHADYYEMATGHGHDAFLAEQADLVQLLHQDD